MRRSAQAAAVLMLAYASPKALGAEAASPVCGEFPPVKSLELVDIYADARHSIPEPAAERENAARTLGVDRFLRAVEGAIDQPNARAGMAEPECAYANFKKWAEARALTVEPETYNREGTIKRGEYLIGLDILALKFRAAGFTLDADILDWLRTLDQENLAFFEKASNRGNLRVWSGAAAALSALVQRDPHAIEFQGRVWREAMAAIHDNGTIEAELSRGQRALIYHMFSFSAALVLRSARETLDYHDVAEEQTRLKRLADLIGRALCDPQILAVPAKAAQEVPGDWAYRIPIGFGPDLLDDDWSRCGRPNADLSDPNGGGDTRRAAAVLKQAAQSRR